MAQVAQRDRLSAEVARRAVNLEHLFVIRKGLFGLVQLRVQYAKQVECFCSLRFIAGLLLDRSGLIVIAQGFLILAGVAIAVTHVTQGIRLSALSSYDTKQQQRLL